MDAEAVVDLWAAFEAERLEAVLDGGWAVDALLGRQTRPHGDLDIALPAARVPTLRALLGGRGYVEVPRPDSWQHNFVLRGPGGREIDVHSHVLAADGSSAGGVPYIAAHLSGRGHILGHEVRCIPPEWLVRFHAGYDLDEDDYHDVRLLCARFGIPLPTAFERFARDTGGI